MVPMNESPYSYIRGLMKPMQNILKYDKIKNTLEKIIEASPECYHAYSLLLEWYEQNEDTKKCIEIIDILVKIDSIRAKYWSWRRNNILNNK
jgi:hypothetical protein